MKSYPKIQHHNKGLIGQDCYAFDKIDGTSMRFEWGRKRGFYKFGTRNVMIDRNTEIYGIGIDIFLDKYSSKLDDIFRTKYKTIDSFVVFGEFYGEDSFAGRHNESDIKDVIMFDINQFKRGFIPPKEFIDNFDSLDIPNVIYKGEYNFKLIKDIKDNTYNLKEGVVCKGLNGKEVWTSKIKTNEWLNKVKIMYGEKAIIEEFNNDKYLISEFI